MYNIVKLKFNAASLTAPVQLNDPSVNAVPCRVIDPASRSFLDQRDAADDAFSLKNHLCESKILAAQFLVAKASDDAADIESGFNGFLSI